LKRSLLVLSILLLLTAAVLASFTAYVALNYGKAKEDGQYGLFIKATMLAEKPQTYLVLNDPATYVYQAISNPGQMVFVGAAGNTQVDDLIAANGTSNIDVLGHYYRLELISGDPPSLISSGQVTWVISGWIMWACLTVVSVLVTHAWRKMGTAAVSPKYDRQLDVGYHLLSFNRISN
jgi:hypothetical protein